jgi:histidinol dehydrogenase
MKIGSVEDHRGREGGAVVYPVYSRRSGGLSVGINLFPGRKVCSFDCPYCEVFPFETALSFSLPLMEEALRLALARAEEQGIAVRDLCFSGNGEPSLSPHFAGAVETAARIRDELVPAALLVTITNGTGLLDEGVFGFLRRAAAGPMGLHLWLKLDAGTPEWYAAMDRSAVDFNALTAKIRAFTAEAPVTIQTMLCALGGKAPPPEEARAWETLIAELASAGGSGQAAPPPGAKREGSPPALRRGLRAVQIYGKARPAPEDPLAEALPESYLETRAASLRAVLEERGTPVPVEVFR